MPKINFTGRVIPMGVPADAQLNNLEPITWIDNDTGEAETFTVSIIGSQVDVFIELDQFEFGDVDRHRNKALDLASAALDLFNFKTGTGLSVHLDRWIDPDGKPELVVPGHPELANIVRYPLDAIPALYRVFAADPRLHHAMHDLIVGITYPHAAATNCARAVEGIRTIMAPGERKAGWPTMRENLNLGETYLRTITDVSEAPRHGDRVWLPSDTVQAVIERSWTIMMRYMEWESAGSKPLPIERFPLLT
jgi:hypothetical protein